MNPKHAEAVRYAELGYPVFPCHPGSKSPITAHGFHDASTSTDQVDLWWTAYPDANIGIPTAGLLVVDVDGAANTWPANPAQELDLAACPLATTPRGGRHYIFRQPAGANWRSSVGRVADHVDIRADGGYIVVAPSSVEDRAYRWIESRSLEDGPTSLPEPPPWLCAKIEEISRPAGTRIVGPIVADSQPIPNGMRNDTLTRIGGTMRRIGLGRNEILPALLATNAARCQPPMTDEEIETIAGSVCRYAPDQVWQAVVEQWDKRINVTDPPVDPHLLDEDLPKQLADPGIIPAHLLRVPGFISEVMDHTLRTAPYPNQTLAFAGALVLQATLAGRKVRDPGDNRTNIYLLALAMAGSGKDWPRRINARVLSSVGMAPNIVERFASSEGLQDALVRTPVILAQTDEIDDMLRSMSDAHDARYANIMSTLLMLFSSASGTFTLRVRAGQDAPPTVDSPCLSLLGTAVPDHYYSALSREMTTNGFFARCLVLESGARGAGQDADVCEIPERVRKTASYWATLRPGEGNLSDIHPTPRTVEQSDAAKAIFRDYRLETEREYAQAESDADSARCALWARSAEHARKLALLYAISEFPLSARITDSAAKWATEFMGWQTRRQISQASSYVAANDFDALCLRTKRALYGAPNRQLPRSKLMRTLRVDAKTFDSVAVTLTQRNELEQSEILTKGRPITVYRLSIGRETVPVST